MYLYIYKEMVLWQQHPSVASFMTQGAGRLGGEGGGMHGQGGFLDQMGNCEGSKLVYLM